MEMPNENNAPRTVGAPARAVNANDISAAARGLGGTVRGQGGAVRAGGGPAAQAAAALAAGIAPSALPAHLKQQASVLQARQAQIGARTAPKEAAQVRIEEDAILTFELAGKKLAVFVLQLGANELLLWAFNDTDRRVSAPVVTPLPAGVLLQNLKVNVKGLQSKSLAGAVISLAELNGRLVLTLDEGESRDVSVCWAPGL
jgi:hypothetical protein